MRLILGFYNLGYAGIFKGYVLFGDDKKSGGDFTASRFHEHTDCTKQLKILLLFIGSKNRELHKRIRRFRKRKWMSELCIDVNTLKYKSPKVEHQILSCPLLETE